MRYLRKNQFWRLTVAGSHRTIGRGNISGITHPTPLKIIKITLLFHQKLWVHLHYENFLFNFFFNDIYMLLLTFDTFRAFNFSSSNFYK